MEFDNISFKSWLSRMGYTDEKFTDLLALSVQRDFLDRAKIEKRIGHLYDCYKNYVIEDDIEAAYKSFVEIATPSTYEWKVLDDHVDESMLIAIRRISGKNDHYATWKVKWLAGGRDWTHTVDPNDPDKRSEQEKHLPKMIRKLFKLPKGTKFVVNKGIWFQPI